MVKFWEEQLEIAIARTKVRIKHMEANGVGLEAIKEKSILKKQEKNLLEKYR